MVFMPYYIGRNSKAIIFFNFSGGPAFKVPNVEIEHLAQPTVAAQAGISRKRDVSEVIAKARIEFS